MIISVAWVRTLRTVAVIWLSHSVIVLSVLSWPWPRDWVSVAFWSTVLHFCSTLSVWLSTLVSKCIIPVSSPCKQSNWSITNCLVRSADISELSDATSLSCTYRNNRFRHEYLWVQLSAIAKSHLASNSAISLCSSAFFSINCNRAFAALCHWPSDPVAT